MRAIILVLKYGGASIPAGSELSNSLALMFGMGSVFMVVGPYLHSVLPGQQGTGIVAHPLFCCKRRWLCKLCGDSCTASQSPAASQHKPLLQAAAASSSGTAAATGVADDVTGDHEEDADHEDPDVAAEREAVARASPSDVPILIAGLRKVPTLALPLECAMQARCC